MWHCIQLASGHGMNRNDYHPQTMNALIFKGIIQVFYFSKSLHAYIARCFTSKTPVHDILTI